MPFVSTTGFLNSDGSTFTAHIATNVSSTPSPVNVAASHVIVCLPRSRPMLGLAFCQSITLQAH